MVFGGVPEQGQSQPMEMLIAGEYTAWKAFGTERGETAFAATINNEIYMHGNSLFFFAFVSEFRTIFLLEWTSNTAISLTTLKKWNKNDLGKLRKIFHFN